MIIGIDPGMNGAIAVTDGDKVTFFDIPTVKVKNGKGKKAKEVTDIDFVKLQDIAREIGSLWVWKESAPIVICEHSAGMAFGTKRFDDSKTAWKKGYNYGAIRATFSCYSMPFTKTPRPSDWKRTMGLTDSSQTYSEKKESARQLALKLFPQASEWLKRKKDSDRAEALLLAVWGKRVLQ